MSDMDFERLLAAHNASLKQQYDDAEEYSNWMPDDGKYTVSIIKSNHGTWTQDDSATPIFWWNLTARIEAGDVKLIGETFATGPYKTTAPGILKGQAKALNNGQPVPFEELTQLFDSMVGKVLRVNVVTSTSKKNGKEYTNCYIQEVIPMTSVEDLPDEPPQGYKNEPIEAEVITEETGEVLA